MQYAIVRTTKNIQEDVDRKTALPYNLRRQLKCRARANNALGNSALSAHDLKRVDLLAPLAARSESANHLRLDSRVLPLQKLIKEFELNGFQINLLSTRKCKFFKPKGASFVITADTKQNVDAEEAVWFLNEEIDKEAIKVMNAAIE